MESEVDKRSKMYKAVKDTGRVVELGRQDEKTLLLWLAGNIKSSSEVLLTPTDHNNNPKLSFAALLQLLQSYQKSYS